MNNRVMYDQNNRRFERVTRTTAERAYNNGLAVVACPVNLRPFAPWHPEAVLTRQEGENLRPGRQRLQLLQLQPGERALPGLLSAVDGG